MLEDEFGSESEVKVVKNEENVAGERHIYSDRAVDMKWHEGGDSQQGEDQEIKLAHQVRSQAVVDKVRR